MMRILRRAGVVVEHAIPSKDASVVDTVHPHMHVKMMLIVMEEVYILTAVMVIVLWNLATMILLLLAQQMETSVQIMQTMYFAALLGDNVCQTKISIMRENVRRIHNCFVRP